MWSGRYLCAWAWWRLGDLDQAWLLLAEAFERREGHHLPRAMPGLYAWMKTHAAEAGVPLSGPRSRITAVITAAPISQTGCGRPRVRQS